MSSIWDSVTYQATLLSTVAWDTGLAIYNLAAGDKPKGSVIEPGKPGHGGKWPEFKPPREGDSRSPCPAMNAMCNHGILPRDGKNISFQDMSQKIHETYNFGKPFCFFVPYYFAHMIGRDYYTGTMDLADLALHNGIEHDASLCRHDTAHSPDQSKPAHDLIKRLLASATGPGNTLTTSDLARFSSERRAESRAGNPNFSLSLIHKGFGSSNSATLLAIYGGDVKALNTLLLEERIPEGWEPHVRRRGGLSMAAFNSYVLGIEMRIDEKKAAQAKKAA